MNKYYLGEFEEIVILTVAILNGKAYGVAIKDEIEDRVKREVSLGALHAALVRLEEKAYIKAVDGDTSQDRAGRPRRYFQVTTLGKRAMEQARKTRDELWRAIPKMSMEIS